MKRTSATQLEAVELCGRKWKFRWGMKMPSAGDRSSLMKGSVLHGCAERYLKGEEVFPEGWDVDPDTQTRLPPVDALTIRVVIERAIELGHIERRPGGVTEQESLLPATDEYSVIVKKDYSTKTRVEDHKTGKSDTYFKKTANALKKSIQMMIYGKDLLYQAQLRGEHLEAIEMGHNQFVLNPDNPSTRRTYCEATKQEIEDFWDNKILPLIEKQKELDAAENVFDIPEAPASVCNHSFGGCEYLTICSGQEDPQAYKNRINRILANRNKPKATMTEIKSQSPADFLARRAGAAPAAINPPPPSNPQPAAAKVETPSGYAPPPWMVTGCIACKNQRFPGFNEKGEPCRICMAKSKISSQGFSWETTAEGRIVWWKGEKPAAAAVTPPAAAVPAAAQPTDGGNKFHYSGKDLFDDLQKCQTIDAVIALIERAPVVLGDENPELKVFVATAEKKIQQMETPPVEEPKFEPPPEPEPKPEPKRPVGRPKKTEEERKADATAKLLTMAGFTLCIGCSPIKFDSSKTLFVEDLLKNVGGYWDNADVWKRRGEIRKLVESKEFQDGLAGFVVVQSVRDPDVDNFVSSLLPFASSVFRGNLG